MQLDKPIAYGRTAEIYSWEGEWVLKLFHTWFPVEDVHYEATVTRSVHAAGLPVPKVGEIVEVDRRIGLLYQRVDGVSMWSRLQARPWKTIQFAHTLAKLHAHVHTKVVLDQGQPKPPGQHQKLINKLNTAQGLSEELRQAALLTLEKLPIEYRTWIPVVAAARMSEGITELQDWLQDQANEALTLRADLAGDKVYKDWRGNHDAEN